MKVGDKVKIGADWGVGTIVRITKFGKENRYYVEPTDASWYSYKEGDLTLIQEKEEEELPYFPAPPSSAG